MFIKDLTIIFINDRCDPLFVKALLSATIAQEIMVYDQKSNNDWPNLEKKLKKLNPRLNFRLIVRNKPIINFANVRNQMIKKVNTSWLLFLDSDEILSSKNLEQLPKMLTDKKVSAYRLKRIDYFHGQQLRFGETGKCQVIRLARSKTIKYQRPVHEKAIIDGLVLDSPLIIKHFPHQDVSAFLESVMHYAQIEANYRSSKQNKLGKAGVFGQTLSYPLGKFFYNYFFKLGFLDAYAGLTYATLMSLHSLFVRIYLYEKYFLN